MPFTIPPGLARKTHERVMYYFREKMCGIPRGSGKEQKIADYLVEFAREHGLECERGNGTVNGKQIYNVVIRKPATAGYENLDPVIVQSHIDMVCQKANGSAHDFDRDPISASVSGDGRFMTAAGTTLGADDGIGAACALAILESGGIAHPPVEALFTSDEEDGMGGAIAACAGDGGFIRGRRLINIDTDAEGTLFCGCAGGINATLRLPVRREPVPGGHALLKAELTGLAGGHSGTEIHKGRANAHVLMARALHAVGGELPLSLAAFAGGDKRNVITREAWAVIAVEEKSADDAVKLFRAQEKIFAHEYAGIENCGIAFAVRPADGAAARTVLSRESLDRLLAAIIAMPNGVLAMHGKVAGLVETSCNLGIARLEEDHVYLCSLIRSFLRTKKLYVLEQMRQIAWLAGAAFSVDNDYPQWEPNPNSELAARFARAYQSAFPDAKGAGLPQMKSIHAGLECGYFAERFPDMDMIACGPTITGAHTTEETLDIFSVERLVRLLIVVLGEMGKVK